MISPNEKIIADLQSPAMTLAGVAGALGLKVTSVQPEEGTIHLDRTSVYNACADALDTNGCTTAINVLTDLSGFPLERVGFTSQALIVRIAKS